MGKGAHGNEFQAAGSKQSVGPNLIIDGPPAPGSYDFSPDRSLVRMADPRIEDPMIPSRSIHGLNARAAKPDLVRGEQGTGRF